MSIDFDSTQPESFGHDYDSSDFDLEILEDLELLKKVMGKYYRYLNWLCCVSLSLILGFPNTLRQQNCPKYLKN